MNQGHAELVRALDPLAEDGAVARFLRSLREELKGADEDRAKQLSAALAALDANDESSLLSRLVRETHHARQEVLVGREPGCPRFADGDLEGRASRSCCRSTRPRRPSSRSGRRHARRIREGGARGAGAHRDQAQSRTRRAPAAASTSRTRSSPSFALPRRARRASSMSPARRRASAAARRATLSCGSPARAPSPASASCSRRSTTPPTPCRRRSTSSTPRARTAMPPRACS